MLRRLMTQAMFERLLIRSDLIQYDQQPVFGDISRLGRGCQTPAEPRRPRTAQDPRFSWGLGSNVDQMVQATSVLSNQEVQSSLSRLARKLAQVRGSDAPPRTITSRRRRAQRPGWVLDVVVQILADRAGPMRLMDIHAAIERQLGHSVSLESISWRLRMGSRGHDPRFVRVARGLYMLVESTA
jgi:hypothetical protein